MPLQRTHINVQRSDGTTFQSMATAQRLLAGTPLEISDAEARRIRARMRAGETEVRDSLGFTWSPISLISAAVQSVLRVAPTELTFGVELEVVGGSQCTRPRTMSHVEYLQQLVARFDGWHAVHDGSVSNGGEVVSPVLTGEAGIAQLREVCDALKAAGYTADRSCGMHVHIGARGFEVSQIANVCRLFKANEEHFDAIVAPSRRNNHYAQGHTQYTIPAAPRSVQSLARAFNGGWDSSRHYTPFRYRKLNLQSMALHGTIEFRQHQGTIEADRAAGWVRLVTGFAAAGFNGATSRMPFEQFAALAGSAERFINSRREYFAVLRAA